MDKRRFPRFEVTGKIEGEVIFSAAIDIRDISRGGVRFKTTRRLNPHSRCTITLNLGEKKIRLKGRVVRSILQGTQHIDSDVVPIYEVAMEFFEMDEQEQKELDRILQELSHSEEPPEKA